MRRLFFRGALRGLGKEGRRELTPGGKFFGVFLRRDDWRSGRVFLMDGMAFFGGDMGVMGHVSRMMVKVWGSILTDGRGFYMAFGKSVSYEWRRGIGLALAICCCFESMVPTLGRVYLSHMYIERTQGNDC